MDVIDDCSRSEFQLFSASITTPATSWFDCFINHEYIYLLFTSIMIYPFNSVMNILLSIPFFSLPFQSLLAKRTLQCHWLYSKYQWRRLNMMYYFQRSLLDHFKSFSQEWDKLKLLSRYTWNVPIRILDPHQVIFYSRINNYLWFIIHIFILTLHPSQRFWMRQDAMFN